MRSATSVTAGAAEAPLVLAIDVGSSSTRVVLYDRLGRSVAGLAAQVGYEILTTVDGAAEVDADALVDHVARCIDAVLDKAGPLAPRIRAVAVDTFVTNIMALDADGRLLAPLITYADTRNAAEAEALRRSLDEQVVHERTGCLLRTSYWPARLAWFRQARPALWSKVAHWITLGEYLEMQLFGRCRVSLSAASWSGLLDRTLLTWDAPLLDLLGVPGDRFSPLVDAGEPLIGLRAPYADRWPALAHIPWYPAVGDGAAANIGSGCTDPRRMALTLGTTGALRVVQPAVDKMPKGLWCYRVDRRHALLGGATSEGGNVYAWMRDTLRLDDPAAVEAELAKFPPDSHGLTVLPFLAGERSPGWAGNVQATLHGLTLGTTPLAILRAGLEAVAYRFALIEQSMRSQPHAASRLIASGGALQRSPVWSQIFADVLGQTVVVAADAEATSRGAAVLALHALGEIPDLAAVPAAEGVIYEPDAARHAIYQAAIARQRWLYERLIGSR